LPNVSLSKTKHTIGPSTYLSVNTGTWTPLAVVGSGSSVYQEQDSESDTGGAGGCTGCGIVADSFGVKNEETTAGGRTPISRFVHIEAEIVWDRTQPSGQVGERALALNMYNDSGTFVGTLAQDGDSYPQTVNHVSVDVKLQPDYVVKVEAYQNSGATQRVLGNGVSRVMAHQFK
jgi:hypothetical protein